MSGTRRGRWIDDRVEPINLALLAPVLTAVAERPASAGCAREREQAATA